MKKILAAILALTMVFTLGVTAFADNSISTAGGTSSVPVKLTTSAAVFSVTVPTAFPVNVASDGTVTVADNLEITNNSKGQIKVTGVTVTGKNGWSLVAFDKDFTKVATDTKEFGFSIAGSEVPAGGTAALTGFGVIDGQSSADVVYDATVAVQSTAVSNSEIAEVVFTIGWN